MTSSCSLREHNIYYRCSGVLEAQKISLRCLDCSMMYNYAQYGNKVGTGFRFYDSEREAVEAEIIYKGIGNASREP